MPLFEVTLSDGSTSIMQAHSTTHLRRALALQQIAFTKVEMKGSDGAQKQRLSLSMELDLERFRHRECIARCDLLYTSHHSTIEALIRRGLIEDKGALPSTGYRNVRVYGLTEKGRKTIEQLQK